MSHAGQGFQKWGRLHRLQRDPHRQHRPRLGHRPLEEPAAAAENQQPIAQTFCVGHDMGGEEDGAPSGLEIDEDFFKHLLIHGVQAGERFVEEHQLRIMRDRGQHLDFLPHALG